MNDNPAFIRLSQGNLMLEVCPSAGGSIAAFRSGKTDLFRPYDPQLPPDPLNMASFPLTPYSNRIIGCQLAFEGELLNVGPPFGDEPHQLHGSGWRLPWTIAERNLSSVTLDLEVQASDISPYAYKARQTYTLTNKALRIDMHVKNTSGRRLPFGLGHHPYFPRTAQTVLKAHLPAVWLSDAIVPRERVKTPEPWNFSQGLAMGDDHFGPAIQGFKGQDMLDHCFAGWDGQAEIIYPEKNISIHMQADLLFAHFVIYIPDGKPYFCAEAVSHANDAFNLYNKGVADTGIRILNDGETLSGATWFDIRDNAVI